jgi:hypothetical protein
MDSQMCPECWTLIEKPSLGGINFEVDEEEEEEEEEEIF